MNKTALIFGIGASLIMAAGTASAAGSCGAEVAELQQKLDVQEGANATIGATDPVVQQPSPSASVEGGASVDSSTSTSITPTDDQVAESNSGANATIGATDPGVQQPAPEANATTGTTTTTDGSVTADSSSSSATTMPSGTVEETSRVGDLNTAAGGRAEAITALKKAQMHADAGEEDACMTELGTAKAAMGIQ